MCILCPCSQDVAFTVIAVHRCKRLDRNRLSTYSFHLTFLLLKCFKCVHRAAGDEVTSQGSSSLQLYDTSRCAFYTFPAILRKSYYQYCFCIFIFTVIFVIILCMCHSCYHACIYMSVPRLIGCYLIGRCSGQFCAWEISNLLSLLMMINQILKVGDKYVIVIVNLLMYTNLSCLKMILWQNCLGEFAFLLSIYIKIKIRFYL